MTGWLRKMKQIAGRVYRTPPIGDTEIAAPPKTEVEERADLALKNFTNGRLPAEFSINLGAAPCNHSCLFCPQSIHKPRKAAWLDMDLLRKVASEMPEETMNVHISSYSETLAAPNLVDAVRILKEVRPKLRIIMATNGSLFREKVIRGVLEAGLDHYSYSFDAPDRESYKRLMQVDDFDKVWNNLERIVEIKKELGAKTLITTHIMGFDEFRDKYEEFEAYWAPKVNLVYWRDVKNWGGDTWGLEEQLAKGGFTIAPSSVPAQRQPCTSIFTHFKMQHDGRYAPCVAAVPDHLPEEELHNVPYLGTAHEITFMEAWRRLEDMRRAHLAGEWDAFDCCKSCNVWSAWPQFWTEGEEGPERFSIPGVEYPSKGYASGN